MSYRFVLNQFGLLVVVLSAILGLMALWSAAELAFGDAREWPALWALLASAAAGAGLGGGLWAVTRRNRGRLGRREALLLVAMSWLIGAALCAAPYLIWAHLSEDAGPEHPFRSFVDCYFESMSGLTTTGATILSDIPPIPRSILLWRAMTHWLGGIGIVVLFVAVLPSLGVGGKKLFRVEAPGPSPEGVRPHIRETARALLGIYVGLTVTEIVVLKLVGLDWFDALCHTLATLATGGFSTHNASIGHFEGSSVHVVIIIFMFLAGVNFSLYYQLVKGRVGSVWRDTELRVYVGFVVLGSAIVTLSILNTPIVLTSGETVGPSAGMAAREGVFAVLTVQTTTGFCSGDFDRWPFVAKATLLALMFVGGSAGSTAGGIKVIRIWIAIKVMWGEIEKAFRPNVIRPLRIGRTTIDADLRLGTLAYVLGIVILFGVGGGLIMMLEPPESGCDFTTASTASAATLLNIGPGLHKVGATQNYGWFTAGSKAVMCVLMAIGRLEVFAILVLFQPHFWRDD